MPLSEEVEGGRGGGGEGALAAREAHGQRFGRLHAPEKKRGGGAVGNNATIDRRLIQWKFRLKCPVVSTLCASEGLMETSEGLAGEPIR